MYEITKGLLKNSTHANKDTKKIMNLPTDYKEIERFKHVQTKKTSKKVTSVSECTCYGDHKRLV